MTSPLARRGIQMIARRLASTATPSSTTGPSETNDSNSSDPVLNKRALRLPQHPQWMPTFRHEVDTASKTTVTTLNTEEETNRLFIAGYTKVGFRLSNGVMAFGPIAMFPKSVFQWRIGDVDALTAESFSLFYLLDPKIDILVIGVGDEGITLPQELVLNIMNKRKIGIEVLPTEHACATFNWLNSERRYVAGAFVPPTTVRAFESDMYEAMQHRALEFKDHTDEAMRPARNAVKPLRFFNN